VRFVTTSKNSNGPPQNSGTSVATTHKERGTNSPSQNGELNSPVKSHEHPRRCTVNPVSGKSKIRTYDVHRLVQQASERRQPCPTTRIPQERRFPPVFNRVVQSGWLQDTTHSSHRICSPLAWKNLKEHRSGSSSAVPNSPDDYPDWEGRTTGSCRLQARRVAASVRLSTTIDPEPQR